MIPVAAPTVRMIDQPCVVSTPSPDGWSMVSYRQGHRWTREPDVIVIARDEPAIMTRTYRCIECGTTWIVRGELDPACLRMIR